MEHITSAIQRAVDAKIWHAALALALTVPDICGQIEYPQLAGRGNTGTRYARWFDAWARKGLFRFGANSVKEHPMAGEDAYLLRCAFLHSGDEIARRPDSDGWKLIKPTAGELANMGTEEMLGVRTVLYVGTAPFCSAVCAGALEWQADVVQRMPEAADKIARLLDILEGAVTTSYTVEADGLQVTTTSTVR